MPEKEIIRALRTTSGEAPGLPSDLLQKASRRLGIAALLYAGAYFFSYTISFTTMVVAGDPYHSVIPLIFGVPITHLVAATSISISLGMFFIAWREKISPQLLCDLGLIYEVIGAIGIDFSLTFTPIPPSLDKIILSCLEKDPEKRPPNAQTLSSQLGSCLSEEFWSQDLAEKWWRTHRPDLVNPDYS